MKKQSSAKQPRNLDKFLFEAGQQCPKKLWLDYHQPVETEPSSSRRAMSATGLQLLQLARTAFPKGVTIEGKTTAKAAEETKKQLEAGTPVLFGAAFVADGIEVRSDILVRHRDGALDLYEVKSGVKIKHRYVNDLALQVHVVEAQGLKVRAAFLLHLNPRYVHKENTDYPPMQLLRSADVTERVRKQGKHVQSRIALSRQSIADEGVLQLPMGTFCTAPFPCPHLARCGKEAPAHPLRELPELTRALELELHKEGVEDLMGLDAKRPGLTFKQRRTLTSLQTGTALVEPFVREELRQCTQPLHFVALATLTDALPRFEGQRPWRQVPYGWAASTLHADGRLETASFAHADRTDPRTEFVQSLAKHVEVGGTIVVWNDEALSSLRTLLDDLPAAKVAVRAVLGRSHLDLMQLFDAGVFEPRLRSHASLVDSVAVLLDDKSGADLPIVGEDALRDAIDKASTPRVRSTTKEKIAADLKASLAWASERMLQLFRKYGEVVVAAAKPKPAATTKAGAKPLPKPIE